MFYGEKWFDKGDLILFEPDYSYILYDEENKPYSMREMGNKEMAVFVGYSCEEHFDSCEIYVFSQQKNIIVPQYQLRLLSKNTEL
jgi:hypothetical protein